MPGWFGGRDKTGGGAASHERIARNSNGWGRILERMRSEESLRVLDIGPTSSSNINFITALGHSIYLANLVEDASKRELMSTGEDGEPQIDVEGFLENHLDFSGRGFDIVLFWDTADYLPEPLLAPVINRLHSVMEPRGQLLAFFHPAVGVAGPGAVKNEFNRYHLTEGNVVEAQRAGDFRVLHGFSNRQIENLFERFKDYKFFLTKDNMREIVVTR